MDLTEIDFLLLFATSIFLTGILTPLMRRLAIKMGVIDSPNQSHKTHKNPVPYLGGVAIVVGVTTITYGAALLTNYTRQAYSLASTIIFPAAAMAMIGLIDDLRQLKPWPRFISQNFIALFATSALISTKTLGSPTGILFFDFALTMIWIVGITNSINFFDNIDGGASGTVAITSIALFIIAASDGQILIAAMSVVLAGSTLGFLLWNRPPARIYMGDAGSLFLGMLVASLTVRLDSANGLGAAGLIIPFFLLAIPILDTCVAVTKRLRRQVSPFTGGQDHLSHRLIRLGLQRTETILVLWVGSALFASVAILVVNITSAYREIIITLGLLLWIFLYQAFFRTKDATF